MNEASVGILHTNDRYNLEAQSSLLVSRYGLVSNETWAATVDANFMIEFWPFIQSNQTKTCVNSVMLNSPNNLFKLGAKALAVTATVIITLNLYV